MAGSLLSAEVELGIAELVEGVPDARAELEVLDDGARLLLLLVGHRVEGGDELGGVLAGHQGPGRRRLVGEKLDVGVARHGGAPGAHILILEVVVDGGHGEEHLGRLGIDLAVLADEVELLHHAQVVAVGQLHA